MDPLDQIPFTYVGTLVQARLAIKLDIHDRNGKDWRGLADYLDYTTDEIEHIKSQTNSGSNTEKLFQYYIRDDGNSVGRVLNALRTLGREDVYKILQDHLPEILARYERRTGKSINQLSRPRNFSTVSDQKTRSNFHPTVNHTGPIPGPTSIWALPISNCNNAQGQRPYVMQSTGAMENHWNKHPGSEMQSAGGLKVDSRQMDSMMPHAHTSLAFRSEDIEMNEVSTSIQSSSNESAAPFMPAYLRGEYYMSGGQSEFGSLAIVGPQAPMIASDSLFIDQRSRLTDRDRLEEDGVQEIAQDMDAESKEKVLQWLMNVQPGNPEEFNTENSESNQVNSTSRGPGHRAKRQWPNSDENGEPSKKINPLNNSMSRARSSGTKDKLRPQERLEPLQEQVANTLPRIDEGCGDTTDTDRIKSLPGFNSHQGVVRRAQEADGSRCFSDPQKYLAAPRHPEFAAKHRSWPETEIEKSLQKEKKAKRQEQCSTQQERPTATQPQVPKPTQQEQYQKRSPCSPDSIYRHSQSQAQQVVDVSMADTRNQQDMEHILRQFKLLSVSMPSGMKPTTHNEGKRKIRVFITYSQDNKKHTQRVINLCDCLRKNNFQPCIDMFEKVKLSHDKHGWIDKKFREADFVFVVISPQYKVDADRSEDFENGEQITYHGLHTRYIYRLMQSEYTNNACKNFRFVPLIFSASGATKSHVPEWLQNTLIYSWPMQYKDLFFHILSSFQQRDGRIKNNKDRTS